MIPFNIKKTQSLRNAIYFYWNQPNSNKWDRGADWLGEWEGVMQLPSFFFIWFFWSEIRFSFGLRAEKKKFLAFDLPSQGHAMKHAIIKWTIIVHLTPPPPTE